MPVLIDGIHGQADAEPEVQGDDLHILQVVPGPEVVAVEREAILARFGRAVGQAGDLVEAVVGAASADRPPAVHPELAEIPLACADLGQGHGPERSAVHRDVLPSRDAPTTAEDRLLAGGGFIHDGGVGRARVLRRQNERGVEDVGAAVNDHADGPGERTIVLLFQKADRVSARPGVANGLSWLPEFSSFPFGAT